MRAAVLRRGEMVVRDDVAEPVPAAGQVLVEVRACGICGSDLHFARHGRRAVEVDRQVEGLPDLGGPELDIEHDVYMGHEFAAEVLDTGPDTATYPPGTLVTSMPILVSQSAIQPIAYSNEVVGGYAQRMLLSAPLLVKVPNGLDARHAALTEPMAVGLHAVNRSQIGSGDGALVLGAGPVGLAVIAVLKLRGVSTDRRRRLLAGPAGAGGDPRCPRGGRSRVRRRPGRPTAGSAGPARRGVRGHRGPRHHRRHPAPLPRPGPGRGGRGLHGGRHGHTLLRHRQGAEPPVLLGYDPAEFAASLRSIAEGEIAWPRSSPPSRPRRRRLGLRGPRRSRAALQDPSWCSDPGQIPTLRRPAWPRTCRAASVALSI